MGNDNKPKLWGEGGVTVNTGSRGCLKVLGTFGSNYLCIFLYMPPPCHTVVFVAYVGVRASFYGSSTYCGTSSLQDT